MELAQYLAPVRKWWWLLLVSAVLAVVSSYLMISQQPPTYQATAILLIGRSFDNPNPTDSDLYLGQQLASTYANISQRQTVQEPTKAALGLDWLPDYFVRPLPNSQLLEIAVTDTNPELAQAVANELANQLILQSPTASKPEEQERESFINNQLNSLQTKIVETENQIIDKENALANAFSAREISELETDIAGLQSKLATLQSNYANLLANTQSGAVNTLALLESATLPVNPIGPRKAYTVLVISVIAVALAAATAYVLEYLDDTIKSMDDIKHISDVPALAGIPTISSKDSFSSLVTLEQPRSPASESFRALRAMVQLKLEDKLRGAFLITSVSPEEGKSLIAANLAIVLAQAGNKTLLVDADMRRPSQHKYFDLSNDEGLADMLIKNNLNGNNMDFGTLLDRTSKSSEQKDLEILVTGKEKSNHHHLLGLETLGEMLPAAAARYNYVIIDSPPLLAAADALVLSSVVDGVILIVCAGKTRRKELQSAVKQLHEVEANVIGVVLNRMKNNKDGSYRYYQYYDKAKDVSQEKGQKETLPHQKVTKKEIASQSQSA